MDRGASPLGNPYVVRGERERLAACHAYRRLLGATLAGGGQEDPEQVGLLGRLAGFGGEVRVWDWEGARREVERLREMARRGVLLELKCHCAPRPCHGETVRDLL